MAIARLVTLVTLQMLSTSTATLDATNGAQFLKQYPELKRIEPDFGVGGKGGQLRPDLWFKGVALIIPQINQLIDFVSPGFVMESMTVEEGHVKFRIEENKAQVHLLGKYLTHFGSDKSIFYQHFHHVYAYIFKNLIAKNQALRTLEIGEVMWLGIVVLVFAS